VARRTAPFWCRLRFINITDNGATSPRIRDRFPASLLSPCDSIKDVPAQWKIIAKDGPDLPLVQVRSFTADMGMTVGETGIPVYFQRKPAAARDPMRASYSDDLECPESKSTPARITCRLGKHPRR
jgi:hypothetical protein